MTVYRDLAQAVGIGTIVSALSFAWKQSTRISARTSEGAEAYGGGDAKPGPSEHGKGRLVGWRTYKVDGPIFFGSTQTFSGLFDPKDDPDDVVIDFTDSRVMDQSAMARARVAAWKMTAAQPIH